VRHVQLEPTTMAMQFQNPTNGYVETVSLAPLWTLLFGGFYFATRGVWTHFVAGFVLACVTFTLSWFIYPLFANQIMRTHYLRRGWIEVSAGPSAPPAASRDFTAGSNPPRPAPFRFSIPETIPPGTAVLILLGLFGVVAVAIAQSFGH
jgi:hypothetical protein